ncbi:TetR/AcrR family transcriptional regulator [Streptomyces sp. NPDC055722]
MDRTQVAAEPHGGRGARGRILRAAAKLFYEEGINTTGMERLTEVAHVSRRTFYQHFPSKNALVEEYLRTFCEQPPPSERALQDVSLTPRERLLDIFPADLASSAGPVRGCPFHNAAVETAGALPAVRDAVIGHKLDFTRRLAEAARQAGAADPDTLARQLALLFEGASALGTSLDSLQPLHDARALAAQLIDAATAS